MLVQDENDGSGWVRFRKAMKSQWITLILVIFIFLAMWFIIGLTAFHLFLVCRNKTTSEQLRKQHPFGSPYNLGIIRNIVMMCCTVPESNVHIHHIPRKTEKNEEIIRKKLVRSYEEDVFARDV